MRREMHENISFLKSVNIFNATVYDYEPNFREEIERLKREYATERDLLKNMRDARQMARAMALQSKKEDKRQ